MNHISGVKVSVPALRAVDRQFEPRWSQIKDYQITASPLITHHEGVGGNTGWLGIRIMCEVTCLPANCRFNQ